MRLIRTCGLFVEELKPLEQHGHVARHRPADALLVLEVGDSSAGVGLGPMAAICGDGGVAHYWVVTRDGLYVHDGPMVGGYSIRQFHRIDRSVRVPGTVREHRRSMHAELMRTHRSAKAFAIGARGGVVIAAAPTASNTVSKDRVLTRPRS